MPPYNHTGNIPRLCNARTDMVEECTAPNISGLNSTQSPYPNTVTAGKEPQQKANEKSSKINELRSDTVKTINLPSLSISKDALSDSSTRFHPTVGSSMQPTNSFHGNLYLSSKKINSGHAYVKKALPQARNETLIQSSFVSTKTQKNKINNNEFSNQIDTNRYPVPPSFTNTPSVVQRNCEQKENEVNVAQTILPSKQPRGENVADENTIRKQNNDAALEIPPPNEIVSSIQLKIQNEKSFFPHVMSSDHVPIQSNTTAMHIQGAKSTFQQQTAPLSYTKKISGADGATIFEQTNNLQAKPNSIHSKNLYEINKSNIPFTFIKENNMNHQTKSTLENIKDKKVKNGPMSSSAKSNTSLEFNLKTSSHPGGIVTHQPVSEEFQTEDERNRMKLINTYGPYLIPSDTSLNAARARLKQAIAQTRELRASFSARVYEKYRIVLRPVPKSVDEIIDPLKDNPKESKAKIMEKINLIKAEKEAEKKEIPNRAAIISNSLMSGEQIYGVSSSASASNIAESEQLFTAGLSLVILPEEEIDDSQYNLEDYEHRGPTDPETGQRLGGISSAAAAAAEALLDRTRRGITYRMERRRRNMPSDMNVGRDGSDMTLNQYVNTSRDMLNPNKTDKTVAPVYSMNKVKIVKSSQIASNKQASRRQSYGKGASVSNISPWGQKRRVSKAIAVGNTNSLLSISANVEGNKKAAAMVIHSYCPKFSGSGGRSSSHHSRSKQNHHPHPESKGGIAFSASLSNSSKKNSTTATTKSYPLALPRLQYPRKRKRASESLENNYRIAKIDLKKNAIEAVGSVLDQFYCASEVTGVNDLTKKSPLIGDQINDKGNETSTDSGAKPKLLLHEVDIAAQKDAQSRKEATSTNTYENKNSKRKRKVTEIGLLRGLRNLEVPIRDVPLTSKQANNERSSSSQVFDEKKDGKPNYNLAFSVLYALGIIGNPHKKVLNQTYGSFDKTNTDKKLILNHLNISPDENSRFESRPFSYDVLDQWHEIMNKKVIIERNCKQHKKDEANVAGNQVKLKTLNPRGENQEDSAEKLGLLKERKKNEVTTQPGCDTKKASTKNMKSPLIDTPKEDEKSSGMKEIEELKKSKEKNNKTPNNVIKQSQGKKKITQKRNWEKIPGLRGDLTHLPQQHLTTQHHSQSQFLPSMQFGVSPVYSSSPQNQNRIGISPIDQRLNHVRLLGNNHHGNHLNTLSFGEPINRNSASPVYHAEYFHGNNQIHPSQTRSFGSSSDWPHIGNLLSPPSMMGGIDLATSQAHAMIGHSAQAIRNQQHMAAVRNIAASISAQQANILMNNTRVPNGNTFQQQRLQQINSRPQLQGAGDEIPMMPSTGLLMTSQRPLGESFSSMTSPQTPSLMYLAASKDTSSPYMKRTASVNSPANSLQMTNSRVMPSIGQLKKKRVKTLPSDEKPSAVKLQIESDTKNTVKNEKLELKTQSAGASLDQPHQKVSKDINDIRPVHVKQRNNVRETESFRAQSKKQTSTDSTNQMATSELSSASEGMRFFIPAIPPGLSEGDANLILKGYFYKMNANVEKSKALEFLLAVGTAVPIPRALISSPLKEKLSSSPRAPGNVLQSMQKEVIAASVTTWLWAEHSDCFQRAFSKSGRIDVDPECKWLINLAIEISLRRILIDSSLREKTVGRDISNEFRIGVVVCETLMREIYVDEKNDIAIPNLRHLITLLDKHRNNALKLLCRERSLLATLVSRNADMSEQFAHSYVSAMVRCGEALGHEDLCEIVQDNQTSSSSLLPYDILSDATGSWDDPCRPLPEFSLGLNADELTKRAHARAQIHKSLFKLQEKFDIKGGVTCLGPYVESSPGDGSSKGKANHSLTPIGRNGNGGVLRRKSDSGKSSSHNTASMTRYNPLHYSLPLIWDAVAMENMPYGRHTIGGKRSKRSQGSLGSSSRMKKSRMSINQTKENTDSKSKFRSTEAIKWEDVSRYFQPVSVGVNNSTPTLKKKVSSNIENCIHIFAPIVRELDIEPEQLGSGWSENDDSDVEDITEKAVLARHQSVLDSMREKFSG